MKHIKYILIPALTGLFFTACNTEPVGPSQAELDAQVETKVKAATDQLKAECDTRLLQAAQMQADSLLAKAAKKAPVAAPKPAPAPVKPKTPAPVKPKTPPTPPAPPKPVQPNQGKKTQESGENQGKKNGMDAQGKPTNEGQNLGKKK